ncbi:hypothetical protein SUGI_0937380 [Cryptomeria japonica]|nr:hypothetical protein SUGI_0937380 [Cryptomeria japonica]
METCCVIHKCSEHGFFMEKEKKQKLLMMEETCDSDSVLAPDGFSSFDCLGGFNELDDMFVADDAESTTSNDSCIENLSEEKHCIESLSYMQYLDKASDDELGLPPNPHGGIDCLVQPNYQDLDFTLHGSDEEDDKLFWLSFLGS